MTTNGNHAVARNGPAGVYAPPGALAPMPPQNMEAERATLGSILMNRDAITAIAAWLKPEHFYVERHVLIYDAMLSCYNARIPPDTRTVSEELRKRGKLDVVGGILYLTELVEAVPTSYHIEYYARAVERTATRRQMLMVSGRIAALAYDEQTELETALDRAETLLLELADDRSQQDFVPIGQAMDSYFERIRQIQDRPGEVVGVPSGFRDLDTLTGGFQRSDLIILAARPSVGKTSAALSMAYNIATQEDGAVGIFSLEMSRDQLVERLLAMDTGIDTHKIRTGQVRDTDLARVMAAMGRLASTPLYIEDTPGLSLMEVRSKARRLQAMRGIDILFIDYLQLMASSRAENRVQEVSEISRGLKALARELHIPIVALSQLSRAVEGRASHVPMLSDLRDSGAIEQDSDIVLFVYREELYDPQTDKKGIAELHIAKHRNGPIGVVPMRFDASTTRFVNLAYRVPEGY